MKKIDVACIIDDDPIFIFGAKRIMKLANFCNSFMIFKNGKEAIEKLKPIMLSEENIPDIILLDLNMPVMDGWQFLDEFIKINVERKVTIYIMSSSIDPVDKKRAENYKNITNFIVKPISNDALETIMNDYTAS